MEWLKDLNGRNAECELKNILCWSPVYLERSENTFDYHTQKELNLSLSLTVTTLRPWSKFKHEEFLEQQCWLMPWITIINAHQLHKLNLSPSIPTATGSIPEQMEPVSISHQDFSLRDVRYVLGDRVAIRTDSKVFHYLQGASWFCVQQTKCYR